MLIAPLLVAALAAGSGPPPGGLGKVEAACAEGLAAYHAGDAAGAARRLEAALAALEAVPASAEGHALWVRAQLGLGLAARSGRDPARAAAAMERALALEPGLAPDPDLYPPSFRRELEEVRARLARQARRTLAVATPGRAARAAVEGMPIGATPASIALPPGRYRVEASSGAARAEAVVALGAEDRTVELQLPPAQGAAPLVPADAGSASPAGVGVRAAPRGAPAAWLRPAAWTAGALALGLAGGATWGAIRARRDDAAAAELVRADGAFRPGADPARYRDLSASADAGRRYAVAGAAGAAALAAAAGILGYLSWGDGAPAR